MLVAALLAGCATADERTMQAASVPDTRMRVADTATSLPTLLARKHHPPSMVNCPLRNDRSPIELPAVR